MATALKHSRQREAIKEFLMTRTDHPTADTVYQELRESYPNISLGTIYRNLSLLAEIGEIQKIYTGEGVDRFDAQIKPHYHIVCTKCHRVDDLKLDFLNSVTDLASKCYDGVVHNHTTNFYGICNHCLSQEEPQ